jgi:tetratricopeptide (TPR) repeat protein
MPMDHTSEVLGRLSQRLDEAADDAERALLLGEVVGVFEAMQSTVQPEIRNLPLALARIELGEVLNNSGRQAEAENQLTLALGELEQAPIGLGEERETARARAQFALGDAYRTTGRASRALAAYGAAVQQFEHLVENAHEDSIDQALALSRDALADAARDLAEQGQALRLRRSDEAASAFTQAIAALESLPPDIQDKYESVRAGCYYGLGSALGVAGQYREALPAYQSSVALYTELAAQEPGKFDLALALALSGLAAICRELRRWDDAIDASTRAIRLYEQISQTSTSSWPDLRLGNELKVLHEAAAHVSPGSPLPEAAGRWMDGTSRWLIGAIDLGSTDQRRPGLGALPARHEARPPLPAGPEPDRRLWSVTPWNLTWIVGELLKRGHRSSDVHMLAKGLRETGLYPARDFAERCLPRRPNLFITYDWEENFVDLQEAIHSGIQHLATIIRSNRPDIAEEQLQTLWDKVGIWIDFLFIDQSARNVSDEVHAVVPVAIQAADAHFVLSPTALNRAWCCYELAIFHRRPLAEEGALSSFVAPVGTIPYRGWNHVKATNPADKPILDAWLKTNYPGGIHGVDALLTMSSLLSDPFAVSTDAWSLAAEATVLESADRWLSQ